jgi:hypothetical protein
VSEQNFQYFLDFFDLRGDDELARITSYLVPGNIYTVGNIDSRMGRVNNNKKTSQRSQKMWLLDTEIRIHVHGILSRTKVKKVPNNRRQPRGDDLNGQESTCTCTRE